MVKLGEYMNKILEYQKYDAEIMQLENQVKNSKEHEVISKMGVLYKDMQTKLLQLENDAKALSDEYNDNLAIYEDNLKKTRKLTGEKVEELNNDKLTDNLDTANKISSDLFMLERKLNLILTSISNILKDFENAKKNGLMAKAKYNEAKVSLDKFKQSIEPKKAEIEKQLKKLESSLDPKLFTKYKAFKHDNVFPVFVPLTDKRCGYCRVEMPSGKIDSLKNEEYIVCEQCGRLIYKIN